MTTPTWFSDERLRSRAKEVVALRAAGLTQREVGQRLGIVQSNVTYIEQQMIGRLGFKQALPLLSGDPALRYGQLKVLANLALDSIQASDLPPQAMVKAFQDTIYALADEVAKLPQPTKKKEATPSSPVDGYMNDLRGRKGGNSTAAKALRHQSRQPGADYVADLIERGPQT